MPRSAVHAIRAEACVERVVVSVAEDDVIARAGVDRVVAGAAMNEYPRRCSEISRSLPASPLSTLSPSPAFDLIVVVAAEERIVATERDEHVVVGVAVKQS